MTRGSFNGVSSDDGDRRFAIVHFAQCSSRIWQVTYRHFSDMPGLSDDVGS